VLVGAATVLVVVVAVYLSYNATKGLPFVPTTELTIQLDNGATVGLDTEVREGGYRLGAVSDVRVARLANGRVGAEALVKLDQAAGRIPVDSEFKVRPKGAIGGSKYIEINRGRSRRTYGEGATVPVGRTSIPVELDEVLSTFDPPTRAGLRRTLRNLGDGVSGRSVDLNRSIATLPEVLEPLAPVMANLADPRTTLGRTVRELGDGARTLAPVAGELGLLFRDGADTFAALGADRGALQDTISEAVPTLRQGSADLRSQRPFLLRTGSLLRDARPIVAHVTASLPAVNDALEVSAGPLARAAALGPELRATVGALERLARDPVTGTALRALGASVTTLQPQIRFYGPHLTVCNMAAMWFAFVGDILSTPNLTGTSQYGMPEVAGPADDSLAFMGANEFAIGRGAAPGDARQHLHADVFPGAVTDDGRASCAHQAGGYRYSGNPDDDTPDRFYRRAVVGLIKNDFVFGPTYRRFDRRGRGQGLGPARVPEGQTFTARPGGRAAPER
jgi:ABC-type transporter Mla subunit MlaD